MLKTVDLCGTEVTRLIIGGNPFSGHSHISPEVNEEMTDYYTTKMIKDALFRCMECGINTMQLRADAHIMRIIREFRSEGGKLHWIAQTASEMSSLQGNLNQMMHYSPIAIYHHGSVTDNLYKAGKIDELKDRLKMMKDTGVPVGLATHMPEVMYRSEDEDWGVDFYMACLHNLSKVERISSAITGKFTVDEPFDIEDREVMYKAINATDKPCLVFKILSAGRLCENEDMVKGAFKEAFNNMKSKDAVVVGMFQKYKDQICENSKIVEELTK